MLLLFIQNYLEHLIQQKELVVSTVAAIDQLSLNVIVDSQEHVRWDFLQTKFRFP